MSSLDYKLGEVFFSFLLTAWKADVGTLENWSTSLNSFASDPAFGKNYLLLS